VPDDHGPLRADGVEHAQRVAHEVQDRVPLDGLRRVAAAVPPLVRGNGVEARRRERDELVPPRVPALGEPVEQQHGRPGAGLGEVQADPFDLDVPVGDLRVGRGGHAADATRGP
jgi:hypothetical protein